MVSLVIFGFLLAFQESEPEVQERFTVTFVTLDVMAFKKNGSIVTDLKPTDFVVMENRKKVEVTSFQILEFSRGAPAPLNPTALPTPAAKTVATEPAETVNQTRPRSIFVLDLESAENADIHKTFAQLERFLKPLVLERATDMLLYSMESGLLTKDFVSDPREILAVLLAYKQRYLGRLSGRTLSSVDYQSGGHKRYVPKLVRSLEELEHKLDQCQRMHDPTTGRSDSRGDVEACIRNELGAFLEIQALRVERAIGELEALTYRFQEFDGLKTLYFISPGFSLSPGTAGLDLARYYLNFAGRDSGDDVVLMEEMAGPGGSMDFVSVRSFEKEFRRVVHACIRNRVIFHTFDIYNFDAAANRDRSVAFSDRGPRRTVAQSYRDFAAELNDGLIRLARESGGRFHSNTTLSDPLARMFHEPQYIYVLGYQSPTGKAGAFRKIKVKVKRRGIKLRYRGGYFGR